MVCEYSDGASYASVYRPGVLSNNTVYTYCRCASGYADTALNGLCNLVATSFATVSPLVASPPATLLSYGLSGNTFWFAISSPFTTGRNVTWFLSQNGTAPTTLLPQCSRPGIYDMYRPITTQDLIVGAANWTVINTRNSNTDPGLCGWLVTSDATNYYNKAFLTVRSVDLIPNGIVPTRSTQQVYPIVVTSPRTVSVSATLQVDSTFALRAYMLNSFYDVQSGLLNIVLRTEVASPWKLITNANYAQTSPAALTFTSFNWTENPLGTCIANGSTCVQQWQLTAAPQTTSLCPASLPQQGSLTGPYALTYGITAQNGSSSVPNATVTASVNTDNLCNSISLGVSVTLSMKAYIDPALTMPLVQPLQVGKPIYYKLIASSAQVSVSSIRIDHIWFTQNGFANTSTQPANTLFADSANGVAYPSTSIAYPFVRTLWANRDARFCNNGVAGFPSAAAQSNATLAICNPFSKEGAGIVQPAWMPLGTATPEIVYPDGTTLLGQKNNLVVSHQANSVLSYLNGTSVASASFSHTTSLLLQKNALVNDFTGNYSNINADYTVCTPNATFTDPCQQYLYLQSSDAVKPYTYGIAATIYYSGFGSSQLRRFHAKASATSTTGSTSLHFSIQSQSDSVEPQPMPLPPQTSVNGILGLIGFLVSVVFAIALLCMCRRKEHRRRLSEASL